MEIKFKINTKTFNECTDREKEEIKQNKIKNYTLRLIVIIFIELIMTLWLEEYVTYIKEIFIVILVIQIALFIYSKVTNKNFAKYIINSRNNIIREKNKLILNAIGREDNEVECKLRVNGSFLEFYIGNIVKIYEIDRVKKIEIKKIGLLLEFANEKFIIPNESFLGDEKEELVKIIKENKKIVDREKIAYLIEEDIVKEEKFNFLDYKDVHSIEPNKKEIAKEVRKRTGYIQLAIYILIAGYYIFLVHEVLGKLEITISLSIVAIILGILIYIGTPLVYFKKNATFKKLKYSRSTEDYVLKFGEENLYIFKNDIEEDRYILKVRNSFTKTSVDGQFNLLEIFGEKYLYYPNKIIEVRNEYYKYRVYEKAVEKGLVEIGKGLSTGIKSMKKLMIISAVLTIILMLCGNLKDAKIVLLLGIIIVILLGINYCIAKSGIILKKGWSRLFNKITKERFNRDYIDVNLSYEEFIKNKFLINELYMREEYVELILNNHSDRSDIVRYNSKMGRTLIDLTIKASDLNEIEKKNIIEELDRRRYIPFNFKEYIGATYIEAEYEDTSKKGLGAIRGIVKGILTLALIVTIVEFYFSLGDIGVIIIAIFGILVAKSVFKRRKEKRNKIVKNKMFITPQKIVLNVSKGQYKEYITAVITFKLENDILKLYKDEEEILKVTNISEEQKQEILSYGIRFK